MKYTHIHNVKIYIYNAYIYVYIKGRTTVKPAGNHIGSLCLHVWELTDLPLIVNSLWYAFWGWNLISLILLLLWLPSYNKKSRKGEHKQKFQSFLKNAKLNTRSAGVRTVLAILPCRGPTAGHLPGAQSHISGTDVPVLPINLTCNATMEGSRHLEGWRGRARAWFILTSESGYLSHSVLTCCSLEQMKHGKPESINGLGLREASKPRPVGGADIGTLGLNDFCLVSFFKEDLSLILFLNL